MPQPKIELDNKQVENQEQDPLDEMMPAGTLDEFRQEMLERFPGTTIEELVIVFLPDRIVLCPLQQFQAELNRILAHGFCQFVEEGLFCAGSKVGIRWQKAPTLMLESMLHDSAR